MRWGRALVGPALQPILEFRKIRADIVRALVFYANADSPHLGPNHERAREARAVYRELASDLVVCANDIPLFSFWARLRVLPMSDELEVAKDNLIGLSNAIGVEGEGLSNSRRQENIKRVLRIRTLPSTRREGGLSSMRWPAKEGLLLLGGILFAFLVWIPVVVNVLPRIWGKEPGPWRWGFEHVPEFFGSRGADHAVASWLVALLPYFVLQLGRFVGWSVQTFRNKRDTPE